VTVPGQLTFEGREVSASKVKFESGLGETDFVPPEGSPPPKQGDRLTYEVTFVVADVQHPEKHDKEGVAVDGLKRVAVLKPIWPGLALKSFVSRDEIQATWDAAHAAQQA
jgi:hypothetical protein